METLDPHPTVLPVQLVTPTTTTLAFTTAVTLDGELSGGTNPRICQQSGQWSGSIPGCTSRLQKLFIRDFTIIQN